jgi:ankyrin repeat protein
MYVHIHNDQVFIFVKVTGGGTKLYRDSITTIASDITCKSLTELGAFLIKAELEIIKYIDNYNDEINLLKSYKTTHTDLARKVKIKSDLEKYKKIFEILKKQYKDQNINFIQEWAEKLLSTGIHAIILDSQTNRSIYLRSSKQVFSVEHETFNMGGHDAERKESILGKALRQKMSNVDYKKQNHQEQFEKLLQEDTDIETLSNKSDILGSIRGYWDDAGLTEEQWLTVESLLNHRLDEILILHSQEKKCHIKHILSTILEDSKLSIEDSTSENDTIQVKLNKFIEILQEDTDIETLSDPSDILGVICGYWEDAGLTEEQWSNVEETLNEKIDIISNIITSEISYDYRQIVGAIPEDFWHLAKEQIYETIIYQNSNKKAELSDKLSVYIQFCLGIISVYLKDNFEYEINLGKEFEQNSGFCQSLGDKSLAYINQGLNLEEGIINFLLDNSLVKIDLSEHKETIIRRIRNEYITIQDSEHFDEFFLCPTNKESTWFSYGGSICCEMSQFIQSISDHELIHNLDYSFIREQEKRFKSIPREDGNYIKYYDEYLTYSITDLNVNIYTTNALKHSLKHFPHTKGTILDIIQNIKIEELRDNIDLLNYCWQKPEVHNKIIEIFKDKIKDSKAILSSISTCDFDYTQKLLKNGANANFQDSELSLFDIIFMTEMQADMRIKFLTILIDHGAEINSKLTYQGSSLLHMYMLMMDIDFIKYLINKGAEVNNADILGNTPLHYILSKNDFINEGILELLLENRANPNIKNNSNEYPILYAIYHKNINAILMLIRHGSKIYSEKGINLLHIIDGGKQNPNYKMLFDEYIKVNSNELELFRAVKYHQIDVIRALITNDININITNEDGKTPLQIIVEDHQNQLTKDIIILLYLAGAEIETIRFNKLNLLQYLIKHRIYDIAEIFLEKGTNVNFINSENKTAIYMAAEDNNLEGVELLIKYQAKVMPKNAKNPITILRKNQHNTKIMNILESRYRIEAYESWNSVHNDSKIWKLLLIAIILGIICIRHPLTITYIFSAISFIISLVALFKEIYHEDDIKLTYRTARTTSEEIKINTSKDEPKYPENMQNKHKEGNLNIINTTMY